MKIKELSGKWFLLAAALLWSMTGLFTKQLRWNGLAIGLVRGGIAGVITLALLRRIRQKPNKTILLGALCYFAQGVTYMAANRYTTAANAVVLQNISPLHIILVTALLNKKLPRKEDVLTCFCLLLGTVLTSAGNMQGGGWLGNLLAIVSSLFYAGVFLFGSREDSNSEESVLIGNLLYLPVLPLALLDPTVRAATGREWLFAVLLGVIVLSAWLCLSRGIKTTPPLEANFITMLEVVLAPIWTFLFIKEQPRLLSLIGFLLVLITLIVHNTRGTQKPAEQKEISNGGNTPA